MWRLLGKWFYLCMKWSIALHWIRHWLFDRAVAGTHRFEDYYNESPDFTRSKRHVEQINSERGLNSYGCRKEGRIGDGKVKTCWQGLWLLSPEHCVSRSGELGCCTMHVPSHLNGISPFPWTSNHYFLPTTVSPIVVFSGNQPFRNLVLYTKVLS